MREVADPSTRRVVDAGREEPLERAARAVDDAQRRIAGVRQRCRCLDDALQQGVERELRAQRDARVDEEVQPVGDARVGLHGGILP